MSLNYKLKTGLPYQQGVEDGIEKGFGMGVSQKTLELIVNLILQSDHTDAFIAGITGAEALFVEEIRSIININPHNLADVMAKKMQP